MAIVISLTNKESAYMWRLLYLMNDPCDVDFDVNAGIMAKFMKIVDNQPYATQKAIKESIGEAEDESS